MKISEGLRQKAADICALAASNPDLMLSEIAYSLGHPTVNGFYPSVELASATWLEISETMGFLPRDPARDAEAEAMLRTGYIPVEWGDYE